MKALLLLCWLSASVEAMHLCGVLRARAHPPRAPPPRSLAATGGGGTPPPPKEQPSEPFEASRPPVPPVPLDAGGGAALPLELPRASNLFKRDIARNEARKKQQAARGVPGTEAEATEYQTAGRLWLQSQREREAEEAEEAGEVEEAEEAQAEASDAAQMQAQGLEFRRELMESGGGGGGGAEGAEGAEGTEEGSSAVGESLRPPPNSRSMVYSAMLERLQSELKQDDAQVFSLDDPFAPYVTPHFPHMSASM